jgi:hypothetical protein
MKKLLALAAPSAAFGLLIGASQALAQDVITLDDETADLVACVDGCCPPTLIQKVTIGSLTLVLAAVCFFLIVRIFERHSIKKGTNALVGRHMGISLSILLTLAGLAGLIFAITGCFPMQMLIIMGVVGAIWLIHLLYALVAVR